MFVEIFEVRKGDGVTVFLGWQGGMLDPNSQTETGKLWTPEQRGDYTLRTFAMSNLDNP